MCVCVNRIQSFVYQHILKVGCICLSSSLCFEKVLLFLYLFQKFGEVFTFHYKKITFVIYWHFSIGHGSQNMASFQNFACVNSFHFQNIPDRTVYI